MIFVITKEVEAESLAAALRREAKAEVTDIRKKQEPAPEAPIIGFGA